jgi:hypothetical protein
MYLLDSDIYGIDSKFDALLSCAIELNDQNLHKTLLSITQDQKVENLDYFTHVIKNAALQKESKETLDILYVEGLITKGSN